MADQNQTQYYPVKAMQSRQLHGGTVQVLSGGSWCADDALNQIAVLLSQITFNQRAMWYNLSSMPGNLNIATLNQVTNEKNNESRFQELQDTLSQMQQQMTTLTQTTTVLARSVQELAQSVQQIQDKIQPKD